MSLSVFWSIYLSPIKHSPISKNAIWDFITGIYSVIDRLLEDQLFVCAVAGYIHEPGDHNAWNRTRKPEPEYCYHRISTTPVKTTENIIFQIKQFYFYSQFHDCWIISYLAKIPKSQQDT